MSFTSDNINRRSNVYEDLIIDIDFNEFERRIMNNEMIHAKSRKDGNVKYDLLISTTEVGCISTIIYHEGEEVINIGRLYEGPEELDYLLKKIYNTMKDDNFVDVPEYIPKRTAEIGLPGLVINRSVVFSEFEELLRQLS